MKDRRKCCGDFCPMRDICGRFNARWGIRPPFWHERHNGTGRPWCEKFVATAFSRAGLAESGGTYAPAKLAEPHGD